MPDIDSIVLSHVSYGHLLVTAHNANIHRSSEWNANFLRLVHDHRADVLEGRFSALIFAEGRGPDPEQRKQVGDIFGGERYELKVAVVTSSVMVRAVCTALAWFNPLIRAFPEHHLREAIKHVHFPKRREPELYEAMLELSRRVPDVMVLDNALARLQREGARDSAASWLQ